MIWTFALYYFALIGFAMQVAGLAMIAAIMWHERDVRRMPKLEATHAPA